MNFARFFIERPVFAMVLSIVTVIAGVLARDYILHLKKRGQDDKPVDGAKKYPARRWVVERTHSWMNRFRRLLIRWEKKVENYKALLHLACVLILYRLVASAAN